MARFIVQYNQHKIFAQSAEVNKGVSWVYQFLALFYCYNHFWATRRILRVIKIGTESLEGILWDMKTWSTSVDLLVSISSYIQMVSLKIASMHILENRCFWYLQGGVYENTIPHRCIVGNWSYTIPLNSPNVMGCISKLERKIFRFFNFLSKKSTFLEISWQKLKNLKNFVSDLQLHPVTFGELRGMV